MLDEIELELLKDENGNVILFEEHHEAVHEAQINSIWGYQIIEIPYGEDHG